MLNHDQSSEEEIPISQRRITPDELKRSLAALDARAQAEQQHLAETLPIGQAVDDLSLEYTPEEIWEEVAQQRAAQPSEVPKLMESLDSGYPEPEVKMPYLRSAGNGVDKEMENSDNAISTHRSWPGAVVLVPAIIGCIMIVGLIVEFASFTGNAHQPAMNLAYMPNYFAPQPFTSVPRYGITTRIMTTLGPDFYKKLEESSGPNPAYHIVAVSQFSRLDVSPDEVQYPVRAIPDGYSIYVQNQMANQSLYGISAIVFRLVGEERTEPHHPTSVPNSLNVIVTHYDGQQCLRCWIRQSDIPEYKASRQMRVYLSDYFEMSDGGNKLRPITIPCNLGIESALSSQIPHGSGPVGSPAQIRTLTLYPQYKAQIDSHTWEDFRTMQLPPYQPAAWTNVPGALSNQGGNSNPYAEFDASSDVKPIGSLRNGQIFHCGRSILQRIVVDTRPGAAQGKLSHFDGIQIGPLSEVIIDARSALKRPYTFVKIDGQLYLRGWVERRMTEAQMRGRYVILHTDPTDPELGDTPTQIQVRIDRCMVDISGSYMGEVLPLADVQLDQHAWVDSA